MNILVVCHYGLYQNLTFSFVHNQIREYVSLGHRVRVIIPVAVGKKGPDGRQLGSLLTKGQADGVELYYVRYVTLSSYGKKWFNTESAKASIRLGWKGIFQDFQPDVIHAHTLGFDSELGAWLKEKWSCPLVVTTHGSDTVIPLEHGQADVLRQNCDKADAVVAVSVKLRQRLGSCGTKTPLHTIFNGFVPRENPAQAERTSCSMIQVGNLVPSKRVDMTIRALAKLREKYPEMMLTVVGQGPEKEKLVSLCQDLGVAEQVCFTGLLPNDAVFERMCQSAFFVMASKPEGFGIVYLEAMSAGCVTIGTEGEGIDGVIRNGENGFLVPADDPDAIAELVSRCLEQPQWAGQIAGRGREASADLTWERNAAAYIALFRQLRGRKL